MLVQLIHARNSVRSSFSLGDCGLVSSSLAISTIKSRAGQELVQRRIDSAHGNRQAVHSLENAHEIGALHRKQLLERRPAILLVVGQDHGLHQRDAVLGEEHVLGAAEADAFGAELTDRLLACAGMSALARTPSLRYSSAQPMKCTRSRIVVAGSVFSLPHDHAPVVPSIVIQSPSFASPVEPSISLLASSTVTAPQPHTSGLPMPSVTTAAWGHASAEVRSPWTRLPCRESSGVGFAAHQDDRLNLPFASHSMASSAVKTICPTAAPGDAGRPVASTSIFFAF